MTGTMLPLLQASFTVPVDLSRLLDTPPTALPHPSSSPAGRVCGEGGEMQGAVEGGKGRGSGEEGKAVTTRRETKRKLWEDLEAFAPKRRSSRVSEWVAGFLQVYESGGGGAKSSVHWYVKLGVLPPPL